MNHRILTLAISSLLTLASQANADTCYDFERLTLNDTYSRGDSISLPDLDVTMRRFQWSNGGWTANYAQVDNNQFAGGSGLDLEVNNITVHMAFKQATPLLRLRFGEYGGNLNIWVNGSFRNFNNFDQLHNRTLGGVLMEVIRGHGNDSGRIRFIGDIHNLAIGGQELYLDDICFKP